MHANRLFKSWSNAHVPGGESPTSLFTSPQFDTKVLVFRDDVLHTVRNNVDHGRGLTIVLAERILNRLRKNGVSGFEWLPADSENPQDWEQAAHTILADVAQGDYQGAATAFDYLVATSSAYLEVAQLVGAFVTVNYFLKNPENTSETA